MPDLSRFLRPEALVEALELYDTLGTSRPLKGERTGFSEPFTGVSTVSHIRSSTSRATDRIEDDHDCYWEAAHPCRPKPTLAKYLTEKNDICQRRGQPKLTGGWDTKVKKLKDIHDRCWLLTEVNTVYIPDLSSLRSNEWSKRCRNGSGTCNVPELFDLPKSDIDGGTCERITS